MQYCFIPTELTIYSSFIALETPYSKHISYVKTKDDISYINYLIKSICQSLFFLQSLDMNHGLITPSNIFINESDGKILLSDYLQYELVDNHSIDYSSPERIKGKEIGIESDIWSCGCIIYYYLTKTNPFDDKNQLLSCEYKELENNEYINNILKKTITLNPRNRFTPKELFTFIDEKEMVIIDYRVYPQLMYNQYQIETDEQLQLISTNMDIIFLLIKEYNKYPELNFLFSFYQMSEISYQYSILFQNSISENLDFFDTFRPNHKLDLSWKQYPPSVLNQLSSHFISLRHLKQLIFVSIFINRIYSNYIFKLFFYCSKIDNSISDISILTKNFKEISSLEVLNVDSIFYKYILN